jgi:anti-sigma regulatory factor (Ser/Thr protein kinase)
MSGLDWFVGDLPCNRRIVATLLDVLLQSGDAAAHARVTRRLEIGPVGLPRSGPWLPERAVAEAFAAAEASALLARRVGQALVELGGLGPFFCHSGVATVEKAYRRSHHWMAREAEAARFTEPTLDGEQALIRFEPAREGGLEADDVAGFDPTRFCEMRAGMLEALPMVFGLLPAKVRHTECVHRGGDACVFDVRWRRETRAGLATGSLLGLVGTGAGVAWAVLGLGVSVPVAIACGAAGGAITALCALAGRSFDLSRQLEAVAGARRGQLALLDQVDQSLAEKLDELAKLGAVLPAGTLPTATATASHPGGVPVHTVASVAESGEGLVPVRRERGSSAFGARRQDRLDLAATLRAVKASVGLERDAAEHVTLEVEEGEVMVLGDSMQIEFMLEQLLQNALDANGDGADGVRLALTRGPSGAELVVEDRGPGIDQELIDEVFDPFFEGEPAGVSGGLGLPICYRIVTEHGGQLHVESRPGEGTRVSVLLPEAPLAS